MVDRGAQCALFLGIVMIKELIRIRDPQLRYFAFALFQRGLGYKQASGLLVLKQQTVRDWFRMFRRGHPETVFSMRLRQAYDIKLRKTVLADRYQNELPFSELSEKYGVPASTIRKWVKRFPECGKGDLSE